MNNARISAMSVFMLIIALTSISFVHAERAAYFLLNPAIPDNNIVNALESLNITVDKIDNENILQTNWSIYDFMVIPDRVFTNSEQFPVNNFPAIIISTDHMDEWHWATRTSQKTSSQPLKVYINNNSDFITLGFPSIVQIYTSSAPEVNYLHRYYKAPKLKIIVSTDNDTVWNTLNAVIATAVPGTELRDGYFSNTSTVYFGISETDYWTENSRNLFKNSVMWLITDFVPPVISNVSHYGITNGSASISWNTDKKSTSVVIYGASNSTTSNNTLTTDHNILLSGLIEDTNYNYIVKSCNEDNYCSQAGPFNFTTDDYTAPKLLSMSATGITNSSVNISTLINELGYVKIYYGTTNTSMPLSSGTSTLANLANFFLNGLNEKTKYYYLANMCDDSGNCRNSSIYNFTTLDITPPSAPSGVKLNVLNGNSIKINWSIAQDDAVKYNIYMSNNPGSFNYGTPNATVTSNEYVDTLAGLKKQKYYVIRAEDAYGNQETNTNIYGKFDIALLSGYNLVSFPLTPFDNSISAVMHQSASYHPVAEIKRFNRASQDFETASWTGTAWSSPSFSALNNGEGYFFRSISNANFTFVGTLPQPVITEVRQGMNLIGLSSLNNKIISDFIVQTPSDYNVTEIGKRNEDGTYTLTTYYPSGWANPFNLEPGAGYWIKANKDFLLNTGD